MTKEEVFHEVQAKLVAEREKRGMSFQEAAIECGISITTLGAIEKGEFPALDSKRAKIAWAKSLTRIARFCEIDPEVWRDPLGLKRPNEASQERTELAALLQRDFTAEDAEYLRVLYKGIQQPLTVKLAFKLLPLEKLPSVVLRDKAEFDALLQRDFTAEDAEYLCTVCTGLKKPMSVRLAFKLLNLR